MGFSEVCLMKPKIHVRGRKSELYPRENITFLVLPRKCLAVVWRTPRNDGRALAAEGGSEVCAAENSHPGMQRILWALIN